MRLQVGFILLHFILTCKGNWVADQNFEELLIKVMRNYSDWLVGNNVDPSTPIAETLHFQNFRFAEPLLHCNLSNYFISGHSNVTSVITKTKASFSLRKFRVERVLQGHYQFIGDFDCFAALNASYYMYVENDVLLRGKGKFIITTKYSSEAVKIYNFDLFQSYPFQSLYKYNLNWTDNRVLVEYDSITENAQLIGSWNVGKEVVTNGTYVDIMAKAFGKLYKTPFRRQQLPFPSHPSLILLHSYLKYALQDLYLLDILIRPNISTSLSPLNADPKMSTTLSPQKVASNISAKTFTCTGLILCTVIFVMQF